MFLRRRDDGHNQVFADGCFQAGYDEPTGRHRHDMNMDSFDVAADAVSIACTEAVISASRLAVRKGAEEVIIEGNRERLLLLANAILAVVRSGFPGKHFHLDEVSLADHANQALIFSLVAEDRA